MFYRAFIIGVFSAITAVLCTTASAQVSALQGEVRGMDGKPMKSAEIRVERKDQKSALITTKTDGKGHYAANGLPAGIYGISVVAADGKVQSSTNIKTAGRNARVDFDLKPSAQKIKHYVWMPAGTGSHIGGGWVPVNENGSPVAGTYNSQTASGDLAREMARRQTNTPPGH